jgi:uncharacterized Rmd1/YagE family protein
MLFHGWWMSEAHLLCCAVQFEFNYSSLEKPHIQNDTVTLHKKAAKDHQVCA